MSFQFYFFNLPVELRRMTFLQIFKDAHLIMDRATLAQREEHVEDRISRFIEIPEILNLIMNVETALLKTSKSCLKEGLPILALCTTIEIHLGPQITCRQDILGMITLKFVKFVQAIQVHPDGFLLTDRTRLRKLQRVRIAPRVPIPGNGMHQNPAAEAIHHLTRKHNGDRLGTSMYKAYWEQIDGAEWKRKQLLVLARDHGWDLTFVMLAYTRDRSWRPFRLELEYDLGTGEQVSKCMVGYDGNVVLKDEQFNDVGLLQQLGVAYSVN